MADKELLKKLSQLGFPLFETDQEPDVNETLAQVVLSTEARLWEGFPVLLANVSKSPRFQYQNVEKFLPEAAQRAHLRDLLVLSLALYKFFQLHFDWTKEFYKALTVEEKERMQNYRKKLTHHENFSVGGQVFSSERLKDMFTHYFKNETQQLKNENDKQESLSLEYALSQVFSPKQKELFLKRLKGLSLTKTEREYFSRTVKKKLLALANPQLTRCAKLLLGS